MHTTFFIFREPLKHSYTLLFVSVYFLSVLHLQYQHILLTSVCTQIKFQENNDLGCMYKQWFKNKVKYKQRAHYICVDLGITFTRRKSITIAGKIYPRLFFLHLRGLPVIQNIFDLLITFSAFCSTTDDAIQIIRLFGQPLK